MSLWDIKTSKSSHDFGEIEPVEVLAEFEEPLTFTFRDDAGDLILAHLCAIGVGITRYLASPTTPRIVQYLRNGMTSIREAFARGELWVIDVDATRSVTSSWRVTPEQLPVGALPEEGVLLTSDLEESQATDEKLSIFAKSGTDGQIAFDGRPVQKHAIDAGFYGKFCDRANELLGQISLATGIVDLPSLLLGMSSKSSYAVELLLGESNAGVPGDIFQSEMGESDKVREAFDQMIAMLVDERQSAETVLLVKTSQPVRQQFGKVLELVSTNLATIAVRTRIHPSERRLSSSQAAERLVRVRDLGYPYNYLNVTGRLIGGVVEKSLKTEPNFIVRVELDGKSQDFRGLVSPAAIIKLAAVKLKSDVRAKLNIVDNESKDQSYTLEDVDPVPDGTPHGIA